jgi:hypothetical protein
LSRLSVKSPSDTKGAGKAGEGLAYLGLRTAMPSRLSAERPHAEA